MDQGPPLLHLPDSILHQLTIYLDGPGIHNWRALVSLIPTYSHRNTAVFIIEEQRGRSPSMALLRDLHSRGWTVGDLARLAVRANITIVSDTILEHCHKVGIKLDIPVRPADPVPTQSPRYHMSAQTCYDRPRTPPPPGPPAAPPTSQPAGSCSELPYTTLYEGTNQFSAVPYKEGGHKLGEGGFGQVFWCRVRVGGADREVAVKVLNKVEGSGSVHLNKQQFLTEQESLMLPPHDCLLPLLGYSQDGPHLCLLYPFMPRGSLDRHLSDFSPFPPPLRLGVARDVCRALEFLHTGTERVVVHRDVKSANVLLTESWGAKLGDFGVVRFLPTAQTMHTSTIVGTLVYMAPEYAKGLVSPAADIYGFGVVLYELLLGVSAQDGIGGTDMLSYIEENEDDPSAVQNDHWSEEAWQGVWSMAGQCVEHNRKKRPSAAQSRFRATGAPSTGSSWSGNEPTFTVILSSSSSLQLVHRLQTLQTSHN